MNERRENIWPRLGLFIILTTGVALAWGVAGGFVLSLWESQFSRRQRGYEQLVIAVDGEPVITGYTFEGGYRELPPRRLDGREIPRDKVARLDAVDLPRSRGPRVSERFPKSWAERLSWVGDGAGVKWYFVLSDDRGHRGYFMGFDERSKRSIGVMSRKGFSTSLPDVSEQFVVRTGGIASTGLTNLHQYGVRPLYGENYGASNGIEPWCVFVIEDGRVIEVNLRERTLRTVLEAENIRSIAVVRRTAGGAQENGEAKQNIQWVDGLAARLEDRIAVVAVTSEERTDFVLPEELRDSEFSLYFPWGEAAVADQGSPTGDRHSLTWFDAAGKVLRADRVELDVFQQPSDRAQISAVAAVMPVPMAWMGVVLGPMTMTKRWTGAADSYREALEMAMVDVWPVAVILGIVCLAAAWQTWRWQRKFNRQHTFLWCAAVFLTGIAGLIGYRLVHGRTYLALCALCGRLTPQRRATCAACEQAFPAPALTGVEVFA